MAVSTELLAVATELLALATGLLAVVTQLLAVGTQLLEVVTQLLAISTQLLAVATEIYIFNGVGPLKNLCCKIFLLFGLSLLEALFHRVRFSHHVGNLIPISRLSDTKIKGYLCLNYTKVSLYKCKDKQFCSILNKHIIGIQFLKSTSSSNCGMLQLIHWIIEGITVAKVKIQYFVESAKTLALLDEKIATLKFGTDFKQSFS